MMRNRYLIISGVFLSDIADILQERGIPLTEENILAGAVKVQIDAHAMAMSTLQELDREAWLEEIESFRYSVKEHIVGSSVKPGTYLGSGERMRHVPVIVQTEERTNHD